MAAKASLCLDELRMCTWKRRNGLVRCHPFKNSRSTDLVVCTRSEILGKRGHCGCRSEAANFPEIWKSTPQICSWTKFYGIFPCFTSFYQFQGCCMKSFVLFCLNSQNASSSIRTIDFHCSSISLVHIPSAPRTNSSEVHSLNKLKFPCLIGIYIPWIDQSVPTGVVHGRLPIANAESFRLDLRSVDESDVLIVTFVFCRFMEVDYHPYLWAYPTIG